MPLLSPNHSFKTFVTPVSMTSTTVFKKCGVGSSSGGQERYILKNRQQLHELLKTNCNKKTINYNKFNIKSTYTLHYLFKCKKYNNAHYAQSRAYMSNGMYFLYKVMQWLPEVLLI